MPTIAAGATNKNINIAPHGTGKVVVGTGAADATLQSDGDFNLVLKTGNSTTSKIEITDGANGNIAITPDGTGNLTIDNISISDNTIISTDTNGNIAITPNGTGEVDISKVDIDGGAVDGITLGTNSAVTRAQIDNINIDGNAITSTDTNGDIDLTPAGTGEVNISKVDIDGGAIDATDVTVGSGKTLNVSAGTLTTSTAQKQAVVDGSDITTVGTIDSGTWQGTDVAVEYGGTGASTHTANNVLIGAGTDAITNVAPSTSGNVLTSNGTAWTSAAGGGGELVKISSTTVTSPTTTIQISSAVNYDTYFGIYRSVVVDNAHTDGQIQFLTYTASSIHTWKASTSSFGMALAAVRSTTVNSSYPTVIPLGNTQLDSTPITNRVMCGCFWIYGAQDTDAFIVADCWQENVNDPPLGWLTYGRKVTAGAINKVGWKLNQTGDLTGTFTLYGMVG